MRKTFFHLVAAGVVAIFSLCIPGLSHADWSLNLDIAGPNITKIEIFIADSDGNTTTFFGTGAANFETGTYNRGGQLKNITADSAWTAQQINSGYTLAQGDSIAADKGLSFDLVFADQKKNLRDFEIKYIVYNGNTPLYGKIITVDNGNIKNFAQLDPSQFGNLPRNPAAVPIPPTALLLGGGLFGVILLRRKTRR